MDKRLDGYIRFFEDQIKENELEYTKYLGAPLNELFQNDEAFCGQIVSYNAGRGHIVIKVRKNHVPRLKLSKTFCVLRSAIWTECGESPYKWSISCKQFLDNIAYHTSFSEIKPLYFKKSSDAEYDYIGCSSVSLDLYQSIVKALDAKRSVWFIMVENFPPTEYLRNLINYITRYPQDSNLMLTSKISYDEWRPEELSYRDGVNHKLIQSLNEESICILQGPPGTGKSYTTAQIISQYLKENKTVCVTTMSNKGLSELIEKEHLDWARADGRIYKTLLTADEQIKIPGTKFAKRDTLIQQGELLCITNYILSAQFNTFEFRQTEPLYDLIVIEEASQAYLTAIAAFSRLGKHCLIVGDPMQLPPIVLNAQKSEYQDWDVETQANGLKTCVLGSNIKSYRITTSFRLTSKSVLQTGIFYNNSLISVQEEKIEFQQCKFPQLYPSEGGCIMYNTIGASDAICSAEALEIMTSIVTDFQTYYPKRSIAIISPFRDTVKRIQKQFYYEGQTLDITVDTIDRIQGMTVDYAILYFPFRNVSFALTENRFNVATSRSQSTTLIISDYPLEGFLSTSAKVASFLSMCNIVNREGQTIRRIGETTSETTSQEQVYKIPQKEIKLNVVGQIDLSKFERPRKEIKKDKQNIYIVDTNVFVECPDILSRIDKQYKIVLSAKVVDELDTMKIKLDEEGKKKAQDALRNINKIMQTRDISMECADMSLLPSDFKRSPDNMILSVALKFKDENPIMLTSDNGLQIKSKGLGITTISLREFLKKRY